MLSPLLKIKWGVMKRKFSAVVFCIIAAVMLFCVFAGCSRTASGGEMGTLELNKKYIHESYVQDKDGNYSYYIFTSADEGEAHYYYAGTGSNSRIYSYTIHFRYKIVGEMAHCFFDSVEYGVDDTEKTVSSDWTRSLGADTDFLMSTSGTYYFNEDYLKEIPNFGADDANT